MNSYFIFVVALTVIYIIYYAFMIYRDLNTQKGEHSDDVEVFVVDPKGAEESIDVTESENGFNIGDEQYTTEYLESETESPSEQEENKDKTKSGSKAVDNLTTIATEQLDKVDVSMSDPYNSDDLYKAMLHEGKLTGRPELDWKQVINEL